MSAAFTPGPWATVQGDSEHQTLISANFLAPSGSGKNGGIYVARTTGPDNEANARLIAAAPELYEAGHNLAETVRIVLDEPGKPLPTAMLRTFLLPMLDALAKARGEAL